MIHISFVGRFFGLWMLVALSGGSLAYAQPSFFFCEAYDLVKVEVLGSIENFPSPRVRPGLMISIEGTGFELPVEQIKANWKGSLGDEEYFFIQATDPKDSHLVLDLRVKNQVGTLTLDRHGVRLQEAKAYCSFD